MLIGFSGVYTVPYLVGLAMSSLSLSAAQSGWLAFAVVGAMAAGSAIAARFVGHPAERVLTIAGTALAIAAQASSLLGLTLAGLIALQVLANAAAGLVTGITSAQIASLDNADRGYARMFAAGSLLFAVLLYLLPLLQARWGAQILFGTLALSQGLALPALLWSQRAASKTTPAATTPRSQERSSRATRATVLLFGAMTLGFLTYGGVYSFSERVASLLRVTPEGVGMALGASTALAIVGASAASALGTRWGRTLPLCGSLGVLGVSYVAILNAHDVQLWAIGLALYGLSSMVFTTYAYATAAALDASGRLVSLLQGYVLLPYALGPSLIGQLVQGDDFHALGWPALAMNLCAAGLVAPVVLALDRPTHPPDGHV